MSNYHELSSLVSSNPYCTLEFVRLRIQGRTFDKRMKVYTPPRPRRAHEGHNARVQEFHGRGTLLMIGTFGNPQEEGAMSIFTTREAAQEFAKGDPFVVNGVVRSWKVLEWNESLS